MPLDELTNASGSGDVNLDFEKFLGILSGGDGGVGGGEIDGKQDGEEMYDRILAEDLDFDVPMFADGDDADG